MSNHSVVVGLSGGVDSSFAAAHLKHQGYDVIGVMLNLWAAPEQEEANRCCSIDSMALARRVAAQLDIPFYAIDARKEFRASVVQAFIDGYSQGITPNPCLICNTQVRWKILLDTASRMGADNISTGHYARITTEDGNIRLLRGKDTQKDQSYVLSMLPRDYLIRTLLPVGNFTKPEVREKCREWNLPTASRQDSQDLCFLGDMDYREFLSSYAHIQNQPGEIVNKQGVILGSHNGLAEFTIGQRKGLRIAFSSPLYVLQKDYSSNRLVVGTKEELQQSSLTIKNINWIVPPEVIPSVGVQVRVRYSSPMINAKLDFVTDTSVVATLESPSTEISPGQVGAIYQEEVCLGGGIIV